MSSSEILPVTAGKPSKSCSKLLLYAVSAIVVILVIAVLILNLLHRSNGFEETTSTVYSSHVESSGYSSSTTSLGSSSSEEDEVEDSSNVTESLSTTAIPKSSQETEIYSKTSSFSTTTTPTVDIETTEKYNCDSTCSVSVVESIPRGVYFIDKVYTHDTFDAWAEMLRTAEREIDIFAYKVNLRGADLWYDADNSTSEGRRLYEILSGKLKEGVKVKLIEPEENNDTDELAKSDFFERQILDMNSLNGGGGGIQHSTSFVVDGQHLFVGSMNFEWKSISQKLDIGLRFHNCPCIASDATRLFHSLFDSLSGLKPLERVEFKEHKIGNATFQFLASPSVLVASAESWELTKLLNLIYEADQFVDIAVMQYFPAWIYFKNQEFYYQIDNAIRMSISRGVKFRILVSGDSKEKQKLMFSYLHSLQVLNMPSEKHNIQVRYMTIPQTPHEAYKDRKFHAKFISSEKDVLIGSSNYAPEYFYKSSGTSVFVQEQPNRGEINRQIKAVFNRYWHSSFSQPLQKFGESCGFLPRPPTPSNPFSGWFDHIGIFKEKYSSTNFVYEDYSDSPNIASVISV